MKTTMLKKIAIIALTWTVFSCGKEPEPAPVTSRSSPFEMTIGGTVYRYADSELYGFYDTNNYDVNVKTSPGLNPIGAGGFSFNDLDENATAGSTQPMGDLSDASLFFTSNTGEIYNSTSGTITYTSHDKTARTISGTFTGVLKNAFTSATKNVTGSFNFAYPTDLP